MLSGIMVLCGLKIRMNGSVVTCLNFFFEMHYSLCSHNRFTIPAFAFTEELTSTITVIPSPRAMHRRTLQLHLSSPLSMTTSSYRLSLTVSRRSPLLTVSRTMTIGRLMSLSARRSATWRERQLWLPTENGNESALSLAPIINGGDLGMVLTYRF